MNEKQNLMDDKARLILHRTPRGDIQNGISIMVKGEGVRVFDKEGRSYLDMVAGVTRPTHIGYGREAVARAAYDQMCKLHYFSPGGFANEPAMELADLLAEITPPGINRFTFEGSGSEAVESAMKLAKHYHYYNDHPARFKIISRKGAYHGVNGYAIRALGTVMPMRQIMEPVAPGAVYVESPYCYRCPYGLTYPDCEIRCAHDIERTIEFEDPTLISAFIGEPIMQGMGALAPPPEYWPIVRDICSNYDILLIIDEVICGFGRTGKMFATEHIGVAPDLLTMAKGISSGYIPLGAVGCTDHVLEPIQHFMHLHTYGNHPVACAAALKNIEILQEEKLIHNAAAMGAYFLEGLKNFEKHPTVGEARGTGLWLALDFTSDKKTRAAFPIAHVNNIIARARERGLLVKTMGAALEIAPPLIVEKDDIDMTLEILDQCIGEEERAMGV
ncbi:Adenosylmethionine-8-amino-7-oxononanoate aminotransferase (EC [Olavius algarvensis Delta 1 endosymbiont]|nr:Adenosylmethionine-8-amino-7-oxononanoate aminotransferase (EC [Olavius algarvensis Delta 1 endosymbiont]